MSKKQRSQPLFDLPKDGNKPAAESGMPKDWIDELAGAICDPIIVYPGGGWEQDLPQPLLDRLKIDRLLYLVLCSRGKEPWKSVCDTEALLYMYPRTMEAPLSEQWTRIYLYLGTKVMKDVPDDIRRDTLDDYDMRELMTLKGWIYERKVAARKERQREAKQRDKASQETAAATQKRVEEKFKQLSYL